VARRATPGGGPDDRGRLGVLPPVTRSASGLAGGAQRGASGVEDDAAQLGAAAQAGQTGAAVAAELELVAALAAVDGAVVPQGGAAVGDPVLEHGPQLGEEPGGLGLRDGAPGRVDARPP